MARGRWLRHSYTGAWLGPALLERGDRDGAREALARRGDPHPDSDGAHAWRRGQLELLIADGAVWRP